MSRWCDVFDADGMTGGWYDCAAEHVFLAVQDGDDRPEALIREVYTLAIFELKAHMGLLHVPAVQAQTQTATLLQQCRNNRDCLDVGGAFRRLISPHPQAAVCHEPSCRNSRSI
jgi:hypothetical protein